MFFGEVFKDYFNNSQFHGLRFLTQEERHWSERVFWFLCIVASWCGCFFLIKSSWDNFQNNSLSFGTDTNFIQWNTSLFAVTVCEDNNLDRITEYMNRVAEIQGTDHDYNMDEVLKEIVFFRGTAYYIRESCYDGERDCPKTNLQNVTEFLRTPCNDALTFCSWRDEPFNCCHYFHPLDTELGPCFSLNSMQTKNRTKYPLISNRMTGTGMLRIGLEVPAMVFIHSPEDVPIMNTVANEMASLDLGVHVKRDYGITEIINEALVKDVSIKLRRCRYPFENYLKSYKYYSYTACIVECRAKAQIDLCNCTVHFTPGADEKDFCDLEGIACLNQYYGEFSVIVNPWSTNKNGLKCDCLPGCSEPEFDLVFQEDTANEDEIASSLVELSLARLPSIRLKRKVVRSPLELVVSMGGTAGLFVGASILSFVEFIYYFTIRAYGTAKARKGKTQNPSSNARRKVESPKIPQKNFDAQMFNFLSPSYLNYSNRGFENHQTPEVFKGYNRQESRIPASFYM